MTNGVNDCRIEPIVPLFFPNVEKVCKKVDRIDRRVMRFKTWDGHAACLLFEQGYYKFFDLSKPVPRKPMLLSQFCQIIGQLLHFASGTRTQNAVPRKKIIQARTFELVELRLFMSLCND